MRAKASVLSVRFRKRQNRFPQNPKRKARPHLWPSRAVSRASQSFRLTISAVIPSRSTFRNGVTEDIITALSKHRSLLVVARNSTFAARCIAPRYQTEQWRAGFRKQLADPTQNHPIDSQKWHPIGPAPSQHDDLLPQHEDLGFHRPARPEQTDDN